MEEKYAFNIDNSIANLLDAVLRKYALGELTGTDKDNINRIKAIINDLNPIPTSNDSNNTTD